MNGFWSALGGKIAERWLTLLILPGALYLATIVIARTLRWRHALDLRYLTDAVTSWAKNPIATSLGGQIVLLAALLTGSAAVGLAAQALNQITERLALAPDWRTWPTPLRALATRRTNKRRTIWTQHHATFTALNTQVEALTRADHRARRRGLPPPASDLHVLRADRDAARGRWTRISSEPPDRPTWSGDRIHAVTIRLDRDLYLDFPTLWPYIWAVLPEPQRTDITAARTRLTQATTLYAWALLYLLPLTFLWWPALFLSAAITPAAWNRTRTTTDIYAHILETTTRLHLTTLATHLGITHQDRPTPDRPAPDLGITNQGPPTPDLGATLTQHLRPHPPTNA